MPSPIDSMFFNKTDINSMPLGPLINPPFNFPSFNGGFNRGVIPTESFVYPINRKEYGVGGYDRDVLEKMGIRLGPLLTFIGPNARDWDYSDIGKFEWMADKGYPKKEISDQASTIPNDSMAQWDILKNGGSMPLEELFSHENLFDNYPELRDVPVIKDRYKKEYSASASSDLSNPYINASPLINEQLLLHEIQHLIQNIEGWAKGGPSSDKSYTELAGEIEARATAGRTYMTEKDRKMTNPYIGQSPMYLDKKKIRGYQIPLEDIVVRRDYV